jgi:hypothetical protein
MEPFPIIVKEGSLLRGAAFGLGASGLGVLVLLSCWGASIFWRVDNGTNKRLDVLTEQTALLAKQTVGINDVIREGLRALVAKVDALGNQLDGYAHNMGSRVDRVDKDLAAIEKRLSALDLRLSQFDPGKYHPGTITETTKPYKIERDVTVFNHVEHGEGQVVTGWKYKDGAATEPYEQFCYYTIGSDKGVDFKVDLFAYGKRLDNEAVRKIPDYDEAFGKCQWYDGRIEYK